MNKVSHEPTGEGGGKTENRRAFVTRLGQSARRMRRMTRSSGKSKGERDAASGLKVGAAVGAKCRG